MRLIFLFISLVVNKPKSVSKIIFMSIPTLYSKMNDYFFMKRAKIRYVKGCVIVMEKVPLKNAILYKCRYFTT